MDLIWIWRWKPIPSCVVRKSKLNRNWKTTTKTPHSSASLRLQSWLGVSSGPARNLMGEILEMREPQKNWTTSPHIPDWPGNYAYIQGTAERAWKKGKVRQTWKLTELWIHSSTYTDSSMEDGTYINFRCLSITLAQLCRHRDKT